MKAKKEGITLGTLKKVSICHKKGKELAGTEYVELNRRRNNFSQKGGAFNSLLACL